MNKQELQNRKQELGKQIAEIEREIANSLPGEEGDWLERKEDLENQLSEIQKQINFLKSIDLQLLHQYAKALVNRYQNISFLGIPDLRDKKEIPLESIFVELECKGFPYGANRTIEKILKPEKNKSKKLVILGDPGAGKSTLLKYQTLEKAKNLSELESELKQGAIPIFIVLRNYASKKQNLLDYYDEHCSCDLRALAKITSLI